MIRESYSKSRTIYFKRKFNDLTTTEKIRVLNALHRANSELRRLVSIDPDYARDEALQVAVDSAAYRLVSKEFYIMGLSLQTPAIVAGKRIRPKPEGVPA